jgi:hypothetical protein
MDAKRVDVKLFAKDASRVKQSELIPVFHGWIQRGAIADEMLIDVADYEHVVEGPGVMLIAHGAQYGLDQTKGRTGLLYSHRRSRVDGGFEQALSYSVRQALRACALLQKEDALGGRLAFSGQEIMVRINDRLLAPNVAETWPAVEGAARKVLAPLLGSDLVLEPAPPSLELFTFYARAQKPTDIDALLGRLPN